MPQYANILLQQWSCLQDNDDIIYSYRRITKIVSKLLVHDWFLATSFTACAVTQRKIVFTTQKNENIGQSWHQKNQRTATAVEESRVDGPNDVSPVIHFAVFLFVIIIVVLTYTIFDCLFIFSVSKLLLNAASYDGEIWHADAWQPRPGLLLVFVSIGVVVTKKFLNVNKHFATLTAGGLG